LNKNEKINLSIINILGEHIIELDSGIKPAGFHNVYWHGKDNTGKQCPTGMYFVIFKTPSSSDWEKILFVQ
jgi:flagellar hook assembly protein FlgD